MQPDSKAAIRREVRRQRRQLSKQDQVQHARQLAMFARQIPSLLKAQRIASYRAFAGEIDTRVLEQSLRGQIFLPRITNFRCAQMRFYAQPKRAMLSTLGIAEPDGRGVPISLREVDAVLVPLVAFNRLGARLGMGAGFYDRALAFRRWNTAGKRPMLIGLAHDFQERKELQPDPWDVPLDVIITNLEIIFPPNKNKT